MAEGIRDGNRVVIALGSFNGSPRPLKADHATGGLKAIIYLRTLATPAVNNSVAVHDSNRVKAALGSYNGTPKTLKATNADGYLRAVITP